MNSTPFNLVLTGTHLKALGRDIMFIMPAVDTVPRGIAGAARLADPGATID